MIAEQLNGTECISTQPRKPTSQGPEVLKAPWKMAVAFCFCFFSFLCGGFRMCRICDPPNHNWNGFLFHRLWCNSKHYFILNVKNGACASKWWNFSAPTQQLAPTSQPSTPRAKEIYLIWDRKLGQHNNLFHKKHENACYKNTDVCDFSDLCGARVETRVLACPGVPWYSSL